MRSTGFGNGAEPDEDASRNADSDFNEQSNPKELIPSNYSQRTMSVQQRCNYTARSLEVP